MLLRIEHKDKRSRMRSSSAARRAEYEAQASSGTIENIHGMNTTFYDACDAISESARSRLSSEFKDRSSSANSRR